MQHTIYRFKIFLKEHFPYPVRKLPIHTLLGCPHRENRTGPGGCIYCYNPGFSTVNKNLPDVQTQIQAGISTSRERGFKGKFIAYFQTYTNTYADIEILESWWKTIEHFPDDIVGLSIGTRPDCLPPDVLALLSGIGKNVMVWLELGLQSANDKTLELINRGHDYACFADAVNRVKKYKNILTCAHIILGLPGESYKDMLHTIDELNRLEINGIKMHHLQVVKNTVLAELYNRGKVKVFNENEYINLVARLLPHISPQITIHRLIGDIRDDLLIAPRWNLPKTRIVQLIEGRLVEKQNYQGKFVANKNAMSLR